MSEPYDYQRIQDYHDSENGDEIMSKYNVVYSPYSSEVYTDYDQLVIGDSCEVIEATSAPNAAIEEAQRIFNDVDFPSMMVFFVREGQHSAWEKIILDVVPVPTFELLSKSTMDTVKLEASES